MNEIKVNHDLSAFAKKENHLIEKEVSHMPRIDWMKVKAAIKRFLSHRLVRRNGIAAAVVLFITLYGLGVSAATEHRVTKRLTAELSEQYAAEFDARMNAYISQQEAIERAVGDGSMMAQMEREADAIAQVVGKMKTKRMKLTETWNILMRVDSPFYANTVEEVVAAPKQWMFFDANEKNPTTDNDRALVMEQVKLWHDGHYPAGLSADFVYGEWSADDYVLRDAWEKTSRTNYWRYPE